MVPFDVTATPIVTDLVDSVQSWFMVNLPVVLPLIGLLIAVPLVIRLVRRNAK